MPTYQYACTDCDHAFEQVQSFSDDSLTTCPACEGRLRKIFNAVGVVFKGSGFYRTDSRAEAKSASGASAGNGKDGASKSEPAAKPDGSASTKTESKSEPKTTSGAQPGAKTESRSAAGAA